MQESNEREQGDSDMQCGLSVAERDLLADALNALPETPPPRVVWERIEAQARAEGLIASPFGATVKWFTGAGLAAAVVIAVLNVPLVPVVDDEAPISDVPPVSVATQGVMPTNLQALMVQSQQIERDLRALPGQPSLVRAGTAATIAELEDRIAAIDYQLNEPGLDPADAEIYWRERVRLMNSLLNLRRAQAQRMAF